MRATFLTTYLPILVLLALLSLQDTVQIGELIRDPNSVGSFPFYVGALSNIGVLFWWSAAVVAAFTYVLLRSLEPSDQNRKEARGFFLYAALFTALLALDDLFMLHEEAFPIYLGVPEIAVFIFYGLLAGGLLLFFWQFILRSDFLLLLFALGFFALSVVIDIGLLRFFLGMPGHQSIIFEDTAKLLGIASWFNYFLRVSLTQLNSALGAAKQEARAAVLARSAVPSGHPTFARPVRSVSRSGGVKQ